MPRLVAVMGPTASGKSAVAEGVADALGLRLLSADAFLVYRGVDIGTNKPARRNDYDLIDIVEPQEEFGVGEWVRRASDILTALFEEGRGAVVVGGTGLYVRALFEEYDDLMPAPDPVLRGTLEVRLRSEGLAALAKELTERAPEIAGATDLKSSVRVRRALERLADARPPIKFALPAFVKSKFVLDPAADSLEKAIAARLDAMLAAGWEQEVVELLHRGVPRSAPALRAIGYDCVIDLIDGRVSREAAKSQILSQTRQYAKRQRTWLRSEPRARVASMGQSGSAAVDRAIESIIDFLDTPGQQDG